MDYESSVTAQGRDQLREVLADYEFGDGDGEERLRNEFGAKPIEHGYELPNIHQGRQHIRSSHNDRSALKLCWHCVRDKDHPGNHCRIEQELWVWNEATRRGDTDLFAPIVGADRGESWIIQEYCEDVTELPGPPERTWGIIGKMKQHLRDRGWCPIDIEVMAFDNRPVVIDYEYVFPEDANDSLYWHSFREVRDDALRLHV